MIGRGGRTAGLVRTVVGALAGAGCGSTSSTPPELAESSMPRWWSVAIGRAHGIRGDVAVEVAHRRARAAVRSGASAARPIHRVADASGAQSGRDAQRSAAAALRGRRRPHRVPRRCAACCCRSRSTPTRRPDDPDECYDHQLVGLSVVDARPWAARRGRRGGPPAGSGPAGRSTRPSGVEVLVPFVAAIVTGGRPRHRSGRRRPAGRSARAG